MSTPLLRQRYGLPDPRRRRAVVGLVTVLALAGVAWLVWAAYANARGSEIVGSAVGLRVLDDRHTELDIDVRAPAGSVVVCTGAAYDADGAVVGTSTVTRSVTSVSTRVTMAIGSVTRASSAKVVGCRRPAAAEPSSG